MNKTMFKNRHACFACTTSYQLIGAISIVQKEKVKADLYLMGMFKGYEMIAERLNEYHIFREVIPVDCTRFRSLSLIRALYQLLFCRKEVSSFLLDDVNYDVFYSSSRAHVKLLLKHELERRNPHIKYVIYEDGMGSYSANSSILNTSRLRRFVEFVFRWNSFVPEKTTMMVTHPKLVELPKLLESVSVKKMYPFEWSQNNREMLQNIFSIRCGDLISERVIIFDVTRGIYKHDLGVEVGLLDDCYKMVVNTFSFENVICKPHPRSRKKTEAVTKEYCHSGIPVEILYAGMEDLEDRILVGTFSTALFTPKMMFNKEPVIICLFKMVWPDNTAIPPVYEKLCKMYDNKDNIFVPSNLQELKDSLLKVVSRKRK